MAKSKMQLKGYSITSLHIDIKDHFDFSKEDQTLEINPSIQFEVFRNEDSLEFLVPLTIEFNWDESINSALSKIKMSLFGIFSLPEDMEEAEAKKYVPLLCLTNLFGIARGVLSQVTANFPSGPFHLPLVDMGDVIRENIKMISNTENEDITEESE